MKPTIAFLILAIGWAFSLGELAAQSGKGA